MRAPGQSATGGKLCASLTWGWSTPHISGCLQLHALISNIASVKCQRLCVWRLSHWPSYVGRKPWGCRGTDLNGERALMAYTAKILFFMKVRIKQLGEVLFTEIGWGITREQTLWSQICMHSISNQMKRGSYVHTRACSSRAKQVHTDKMGQTFRNARNCLKGERESVPCSDRVWCSFSEPQNLFWSWVRCLHCQQWLWGTGSWRVHRCFWHSCLQQPDNKAWREDCPLTSDVSSSCCQ